MVLKDFSFDLVPARTDGLAKLVERFQVDKLPETREFYTREPHLRGHLSNVHGWLDVWPDWVCARLLTLELGPEESEKGAIGKIKGPIQDLLKELASRDLPKLEFFGKVYTGQECRMQFFKIKSKPNAFIAEIRDKVRALAESLGFKVKGLIEDIGEVHIVIRGKYKNFKRNPPQPADLSDFTITFDKFGFRTRAEFGTGKSDKCGSVVAVNFGASPYITSGGRFQRFLVDVSSSGDFPPLPRRDIRNVACNRSATPPILWLHPSTTIPLENDVEVAKSASLLEADRATAPRNAQIAGRVLSQTMVSETLVLLKVKRDPQEFHDHLKTCGELQKCRDDLKAAGESFLLPGGAKAFVHPHQLDVGVKAAEWSLGRGLRLTAQHVLVSPDYEGAVRKAIQEIPKKANIGVPRSSRVPLGAASEMCTWVADGFDAEITHTFIDIKVPRDASSTSMEVQKGLHVSSRGAARQV